MSQWTNAYNRNKRVFNISFKLKGTSGMVMHAPQERRMHIYIRLYACSEPICDSMTGWEWEVHQNLTDVLWTVLISWVTYLYLSDLTFSRTLGRFEALQSRIHTAMLMLFFWTSNNTIQNLSLMLRNHLIQWQCLNTWHHLSAYSEVLKVML